ncbi:MAG TPA: GatB/YqeY domain-containing protein [Syntrophobacter fumaroxidans]|nr:GatB/YqeY domain-containing protein [Syntrophobacter fumaroxidans]
MMALLQDIEQALKDGIREKNENKRNAVRLLLTAVKVKEKELRRLPNEMEIQQLISTQIKQRRESAEQYAKANRPDLAGMEEAEIAVLQAFLPEALSPESLERLIDEVIAEVGAQSARDMGKVMKALMPRVGGRAEGKAVNELVRRKLSA